MFYIYLPSQCLNCEHMENDYKKCRNEHIQYAFGLGLVIFYLSKAMPWPPSPAASRRIHNKALASSIYAPEAKGMGWMNSDTEDTLTWFHFLFNDITISYMSMCPVCMLPALKGQARHYTLCKPEHFLGTPPQWVDQNDSTQRCIQKAYIYIYININIRTYMYIYKIYMCIIYIIIYM